MMMIKRCKRGSAIVVAALLAVVLSSAAARATITLDMVHVGNAGNNADTRYESPGYGAVAYEYDIGKYEVTAGQYTAFLNAVAGVDTYGLYSSGMEDLEFGSGISRSGGGTLGDPYTYSVDAAFVNRPVNFVSWGDAARFANWMTHGQPTGAQDATTTEDGSYTLNGATSQAALNAVTRNASSTWVIPTEDEWYKAAYYNPGTASYYDYATSSDSVPGRDLDDASGNNANYYAIPYPIDSPYYYTQVGEFQNSASPFSTFDQSGNVHEWNEAIIVGAFNTVRGFRGGSADFDEPYLIASFRYSSNPTNEGSDSGFRLSMVPEPGTLALLVLAAGAMIRRLNR